MTLGPVEVMGVGVVLILCVEEVMLLSDIMVDYIAKFKCLLVACSPLNDPSNGIMNCSLGDDNITSYEDTCSFTCKTGYELTGSDTRTCQSDGNWSSSDNVCRKGNVHMVATGFIMLLISIIIILPLSNTSH